MDKNDFDLDDVDFEEEYGFDPNDFSLDDDDFNYSDILGEGEASEDPDATRAYHFDENGDAFAQENAQQVPEEDYDEEPAEEAGPEDADMSGESNDGNPPDEYGQEYDEPEQEYEENPGDYPEDYPIDGDEQGENAPKKKKKGSIKLPKISLPKKSGKKKPKAAKQPSKPNAVSKLIEMYMEPVARFKAEETAIDPLDPRYIRRRKREKKRIFKDVYLPAMIVIVAVCLMLSFIVGSVSNALTLKRNKDITAQQQAQQQASAADAAETEYKSMMAKVETLVTQYDYDGAIELLDSYSGSNDKYQSQITSKKAELVSEKDQLTEIKDVSSIPNLSFHVLMADASRACNKEVSGDLAGSYNRNFVSTEEFSRILNQLYAANYVLVDFNSFVETQTGIDGNENFFTKSIYLPSGKKPIMITETMVNYFEYMVDPDKDSTPDANGHGFANKLVLDDSGNIKASYVDASGQTLIGNYDLVPILESFIEEHPDFVYQGARAILAVTGSEGVFGYRTNTSYVSRFGQSFYDNEVADAKKLVEALREKGYTIASYTYSNQAYKSMTTLQIQAEVTNWTNQITPVLGEVDTIVFARGSDIEAYSGTTFNVLYNSGLRFFLNSGTSPRVDVNTTFVKQTRLMVTGESMAWYSSQFSSYFDCNVVLDVASRGSTPTKS